MEAVVLAGGFGTRLRTVVSDVPKPMAPVAGKPFLEHLLAYWISQGVSRLVLSVGYLNEQIQNHFSNSFRGIPVTYSIEKDPLGTGGGVLQAAQKVEGEGFLLINGDTFCETPLKEFIACHIENRADVSMILRRESDVARYGEIIVDKENQVVEFGKKGDQHKPGFINAGVYLFQKGALQPFITTPIKAMGLEHDLMAGLLKDGKKIQGFAFNGKFIDIGIPEDYFLAQKFFT